MQVIHTVFEVLVLNVLGVLALGYTVWLITACIRECARMHNED